MHTAKPITLEMMNPARYREGAIVTAAGTPVPPQNIVAALRHESPRLSLKFLQGGWAIMLQWSDVDRRRETVRAGITPEANACDMLGMLPADCSVEDAHNYYVQALKNYGGSNAAEVKDMLNRIHAWNADQHQRNAQATEDFAAEIAPTYAAAIAEETGQKANARVFQNEGTLPTTGKKRTVMASEV